MYQPSSPDHIRSFFDSLGRRVISFAGFGELGYEDEGVVERVVREVADGLPRDRVLLNAGTLLRTGGEDGIARVYEVARRLGFQTSGIHPSLALDYADTHPVSPFEDYVFFVEDSTWGGMLDSGEPSPTLRTILEISDELVVIGGGKHAADELQAFLSRGKTVRYYPANMNRRAARDWRQRGGVAIDDYRGAAHGAWLALRGERL